MESGDILENGEIYIVSIVTSDMKLVTISSIPGSSINAKEVAKQFLDINEKNNFAIRVEDL